VSTPPTGEATRAVPASAARGRALGGAAVLGLGVALGFAVFESLFNDGQRATDAAQRLPALLAALLLVAHGFFEVRDRDEPRAKAKPRRTDKKGRPMLQSGDLVPISLIALAVWLGGVQLRSVAPSPLLVLSLLAAFVLFVFGYLILLPEPKPPSED
jgi:hypothetical protein